MNLWKHDDQTRYDDTIYGGSNRLLVRFDVPAEASLRHMEQTVLKPLLKALTSGFKKAQAKRLDVTLTCYSTATLFDCGGFLPTSSAIRQFLHKNYAPVHDWRVLTYDQQNCDALEFEIKILGADLCP